MEQLKQLYSANAIKVDDYIPLTLKTPLGRLRLNRRNLKWVRINIEKEKNG